MKQSEEVLKEISKGSVQDLKDVMDELDSEDVAALYDMEVAKSTPRNSALDLLQNFGSSDEPKEDKPLDPNAFNTSQPYEMVWEKGDKCILQDNKIFNAVTKKLIRKIEKPKK